MLSLAGLGSVGCRSAGSEQGHGFDKLRLSSVSGHVQLEAENREERQESKSGEIDQTETTLREEVMLRLLGFYYHPKLVDFDLRATLGLEQVDFESTGGVDQRSLDGDNNSYNFKSRFFKDNLYSADLYSFRNETRTRQSFFPTTEAVVSETGVNLYAKEWFIPTRLHYSSYSYDGRGFDTFEEDRETLILDGHRFQDDAQYHYSIESTDIDLPASGQTIEDLNVTGSAINYLGADRQHRLSNNFRARDQGGTISTQSSTLNSSYNHRWTSALESNHGIQLSATDIEGATTDTATLSSGLTHQLFESLTSTGNVRVSTAKVGEGDIDTIGGDVQFNYRKATPIGRLNMRYFADGYIQDQGMLRNEVAILDEAHVNDLGIPIFLENPAVNHGKVSVTDVTGLILYSEGSDYFLTRVSSRTRIDIPVSSLIVPGQAILVDYTYAPVPEQRFRSITQNTSLRLNIFDAADIDLSYGTTNQTLLDGFDLGTLDNTSRKRAAIQFYPFNAVIGASYEKYDSSFAPFDRTRYHASYHRPLFSRGTWQLAASTFTTSFENEANTERGTTASLSINAALGRYTTGELRGEYRKVDFRTDSGDGYLLELNWRRQIRSLVLALTARYSDEEFEVATDQRIISVLFTLTRTF